MLKTSDPPKNLRLFFIAWNINLDGLFQKQEVGGREKFAYPPSDPIPQSYPPKLHTPTRRPVHYFIQEVPPCGFCQAENTSDEGVLHSHSAVARQMLAFESGGPSGRSHSPPEGDRERRQGAEWRSTNYTDKHAWDSDNLFWQSKLSGWALLFPHLFIYLFHFIDVPFGGHFLLWLTVTEIHKYMY